MIDLSFAVVDCRPEPYGAAPMLKFRLQIREAAAQPVHAALLRCQLQIEPRRRRHSAAEQERMADLFGEPDRWTDTLRPLIWAYTSLALPAFDGSIEIDLPVPCTYDLEVVAAKYLYSLEGGDVPLLFLFSGTVFAKTTQGFQVHQISWDKEASFRMPQQIWKDLMDSYFPGYAWIRLRHDSMDLLRRFRARNAYMNWDDTIEALVSEAEKPAR